MSGFSSFAQPLELSWLFRMILKLKMSLDSCLKIMLSVFGKWFGNQGGNQNLIWKVGPKRFYYYKNAGTGFSIIKFLINFQNQTEAFSMSKNPTKVSKFILKLLEILESPKYHEIIKWTEDGTGVEIMNRKQLQIKVLTDHFKLKKVTSFIRQLHLYGFYKTRSQKRGNIFEHPLFQKLITESYSLIKRKYKEKQTQTSKESLDTITNQDKDFKQSVSYPQLCSIRSFSVIFKNSEERIVPNEIVFQEWYLNKDDDFSFFLDDCLN